jgi:TM2 domain-containing membrane protein YozV
MAAGGVSPKSWVTALVLALPMLIGPFGAHRFYVGKTGTAVAMLLLSIVGYATAAFVVGIFLAAGAGIWSLIDCIMIGTGKFTDKNGLLIKQKG